MWYTVRERDGLRLFFGDGRGLCLPDGAVGVSDTRIASLARGTCVLRDLNGCVLSKKPFVTTQPHRLIPRGAEWLAADEDTGCLYLLSSSGALTEVLKIGEHISDLDAAGQRVWATVYHDDRLCCLEGFRIIREKKLPAMPLRVRVSRNAVFVLTQNGFSTVLTRLNERMEEEARFSFLPQPCELFLEKDRLFFCGSEQRAALSLNLKPLFNKKSTVEVLCRDASCAVFYHRGRAYRSDAVTGILYPV